MTDEVPPVSDVAGELDADLDLIGQVITHRLAQDDIKRLLDTMGNRDQAHFTDKLADILRKASALLEVASRVSDTLSLDVLLPRMVEIVSEFLNADRATLFLNDHRANELYSRIAQGSEMAEIRFPNHLGIAGSVFTSGKSVIIPDAYADERFNPAIDKKTGYRTRNILCAPIRNNKGAAIGVAQVLNKHDGPFTDDDLRLLQSITGQAASAFMNAQLHEQIERARREEEQLLAVTTAISKELHLEPLLQRIMETVTELLDADRSTLFMHDPKNNELWSRVAQGEGISEIRFPAHLGIAGSVFTSRETVNIPDAYQDERFNKEIDKKTGYKTDTILCMPVLNKKDTCIGVIQVLNKRGGPFTQVDEQRLAAFSSQASIAIENAQLFEDIVTIKNYNESILASMSNGVITTSADGVIVTANEAGKRLFRLENKPEAIVGKDVDVFFGGRNEWVVQMLDAVAASGNPDVAMDADLYLLKEGMKAANERRREKASVNIQAVPLNNAKGDSMGCMLMVEDITNEKRLRGTMARYMPKEVADKLMEEGAEVVLGGQMQTATVLFTDIRSFTGMSERLGPQEIVAMLNEYFSIMVDVIMENHGILDKYIGDAIMAVFGAPFASPEDPDNAVKTGIGMMRALKPFNLARREKGEDEVHMGIGINTDRILSGNIGSLKRMDYTVIGDGVNLASRLEGANKPYGTQILISDQTVDALQGEYRLRQVDKIRVKGKYQPVAVFEVLDHYDEEDFPNLPDVIAMYENGLECYRQREWKQAEHIFHDVLLLNPNDGVSRMYRERCEYFAQNPPGDDWDGIWVMKSK